MKLVGKCMLAAAAAIGLLLAVGCMRAPKRRAAVYDDRKEW